MYFTSSPALRAFFRPALRAFMRSMAGAALALLVCTLVCGIARAATPARLTVTDVWVRLPAVADRPAAAYMTITGGAAPDRLTGASSPHAARAELHAMSMAGGVMKMAPMAGADVPAGGTVKFAPGGNHVMLFGLDPAVKPGAAMPMTLRFEKAGTITVNAHAIAAGDAAPMPDMPMNEHTAH
jgi:periplasmic copper chaperone A